MPKTQDQDRAADVPDWIREPAEEELSDPLQMSDEALQAALASPALRTWRSAIRTLDNRAHAIAGTRRNLYPRGQPLRSDVVAVGALNVDHIVYGAVSDAPLQHSKLLLRSAARERTVTSEDDLDSLLDRVSVTAHSGGRELVVLHSLGGAAFSVLRTLGDADIGLKLAGVGVEGTSLFPGMLTHTRRVSEAVDTRWYFTDRSTHVGRCVSLVTEDPDRRVRHQMGVWTGANRAFAELVSIHFWDIVDTCAASSHLHVTSLFDEPSAGVLADLVLAVRSASPDTVVSLDPGGRWLSGESIDDENSAVDSLLRAADIVFLTSIELDLLAERIKPASPPSPLRRGVAASVEAVSRIWPVQTLIVSRLPHRATVFHRSGGSLSVSLPWDGMPEVDDTGAGDLFAAGVLAGLTRGTAASNPHAQPMVTNAAGTRQLGRLRRGYAASGRALADEAKPAPAEPAATMQTQWHSALWLGLSLAAASTNVPGPLGPDTVRDLVRSSP